MSEPRVRAAGTVMRIRFPIAVTAALSAAGCGDGGSADAGGAGGSAGGGDCQATTPHAAMLKLEPAWSLPKGAAPLSFIREAGGGLAVVCSASVLRALAVTASAVKEASNTSIDGCRRLAADAGLVAVLGHDSILTFRDGGGGKLLAGPTLTPLPEPVRDLAVSGSDFFVAAGSGGVRRWRVGPSALTEHPALAAGTTPYAVAVAAGNLFVGLQLADGTSRITRHRLSDDVPLSLDIDGLVESLVVDSARGLAVLGGYGVVDFDAGTMQASPVVPLDAATIDARVVAEAGTAGSADVVAVNRTAIVRLGPVGALTERASVYRTDRGRAGGEWYEGVASVGGRLLALRTRGLDWVTLPTYEPVPILLTDRVRLDVFGETHRSLGRYQNPGAEELVIDGVDSDTPGWTAKPYSDAEPDDAACPARGRVEPAGVHLFQVAYSGGTTASEATLTLHANTPDLTELSYPVSYVPKPSRLAVGDAAPDFTLPLFGGGALGLGEVAGKVVYLKFFNPG